MSTKAKSSENRKRRRTLATREDIIEATLECFIEIGYVRTTTTEIAKKANVTRGAVQHYFPTTKHVLQAAIEYLQNTWIDTYFEAARNTPPGKDYIDHAVDNLWLFVNNRLYIAWQELVAASRTDVELRAVIEPAAAQYDKARRDMGSAVYPDFIEAGENKFYRLRDSLRFLLEGLTTTILTYDSDKRVKEQLDWIKEELHREWEPETSDHRIELNR